MALSSQLLDPLTGLAQGWILSRELMVLVRASHVSWHASVMYALFILSSHITTLFKT